MLNALTGTCTYGGQPVLQVRGRPEGLTSFSGLLVEFAMVKEQTSATIFALPKPGNTE